MQFPKIQTYPWNADEKHYTDWLQLREKPACHDLRNCLLGKYFLWSLAKNWRLLTSQ